MGTIFVTPTINYLERIFDIWRFTPTTYIYLNRYIYISNGVEITVFYSLTIDDLLLRFQLHVAHRLTHEFIAMLGCRVTISTALGWFSPVWSSSGQFNSITYTSNLQATPKSLDRTCTNKDGIIVDLSNSRKPISQTFSAVRTKSWSSH